MSCQEAGRNLHLRPAGANHRKFISDKTRKHMLHVLMHDDVPFALHLRTCGTTMLIDVFQERKAERDHPFGGAAGARLTPNRPQDLMNAALEQIVFIAKMRIERRPAHVRAVEDLLNGD
jgi:hypothetical protein